MKQVTSEVANLRTVIPAHVPGESKASKQNQPSKDRVKEVIKQLDSLKRNVEPASRSSLLSK